MADHECQVSRASSSARAGAMLRTPDIQLFVTSSTAQTRMEIRERRRRATTIKSLLCRKIAGISPDPL